MSRMVGNWLTQKEKERVNRYRAESKTDAQKEKIIKESDNRFLCKQMVVKIPD